MNELFDPNFLIHIKSDKPVDELVSAFRAEYASIITRWQGQFGQSEHYYFDMGRDIAFEMGLTEYRYEMLVAGKGEWEDPQKQKEHFAFTKSILAHLEKQGCETKLSAYFSLDE